RGPGAVKNIGGDVLIIARHQIASAFVDHHETGRVRRADALVCIIDARGGVDVEVIATNQNRPGGAVWRPDARPRGQIEDPNYVSVERTRLEHSPVNGRMQWLGLYRGAGYRFGRRTETLGRRHVRAFVAKRAVVAVGHSLGV